MHGNDPDAKPTRGERNNNPGNIAFDPRNAWQGQIGIETTTLPGERPRFAVFDCAENGIRAIGKILLHYRHVEHLETVRALVARWAPATENDAEAYAEDVARQLAIAADAPLDLGDPTLLHSLVAAIIRHENGRCLYSATRIADGVGRALGPTPKGASEMTTTATQNGRVR
ncbi:MAG: structural protein P5 [Alphaproteobacteria bacterium]|nr:structural protein P5 [Alphaproteobacteria bacterium]